MAELVVVYQPQDWWFASQLSLIPGHDTEPQLLEPQRGQSVQRISLKG